MHTKVNRTKDSHAAPQQPRKPTTINTTPIATKIHSEAWYCATLSTSSWSICIFCANSRKCASKFLSKLACLFTHSNCFFFDKIFSFQNKRILSSLICFHTHNEKPKSIAPKMKINRLATNTRNLIIWLPTPYTIFRGFFLDNFCIIKNLQSKFLGK